MVATMRIGFETPLLFFGNHVFTLTALWFLQVMGYLIIAWFEERSLSKRFGEEYRAYKSKVPFMFPVKNPEKIPELRFTVLIVLMICFVLLVLPYDFIRAGSAAFFPNPPPW
jgi:hypothetical protein